MMTYCTVGQLLNSLWVRFGLVYNINFDSATVDLKLIRDIIKEAPVEELLYKSSAPELINYQKGQYIKLSAKTSIEGAAPLTERFEDFVKGLDLSKVCLGYDVSQWLFIGDGNGSGHWDGDVGDFENMYNDDDDWDVQDPPDPDYPDPDDDRDDGRDYHVEALAAASTKAGSSGHVSEPFLAREFITGGWFKIDNLNKSLVESSSSFFNWDPATPSLEALELSSDDECVPIIRVSTGGTNSGNYFNNKCPGYLTGSRHYHSFIKGSDTAAEEGGETPLAFVICYTTGGKSFGRLTAEGDDGFPIELSDGSKPDLSLLFQFRDGLFAKFWAGYDEMLRHGNRSVELPAVFSVAELSSINLLSPVSLRGVRCLFDNFSYSLPTVGKVPVEITLRALSTVGKYNIREEQNVPDFSAAKRHLAWTLKSETFSDDLLLDYANKLKAARSFKDVNHYQPYHKGIYYYDVTPNGLTNGSIERVYPIWSLDSKLEPPTQPGQRKYKDYQARITYDVWETREWDDNDWETTEKLGTISITISYSVQLVSRWVSD